MQLPCSHAAWACLESLPLSDSALQMMARPEVVKAIVAKWAARKFALFADFHTKDEQVVEQAGLRPEAGPAEKPPDDVPRTPNPGAEPRRVSAPLRPSPPLPPPRPRVPLTTRTLPPGVFTAAVAAARSSKPRLFTSARRALIISPPPARPQRPSRRLPLPLTRPCRRAAEGGSLGQSRLRGATTKLLLASRMAPLVTMEEAPLVTEPGPLEQAVSRSMALRPTPLARGGGGGFKLSEEGGAVAAEPSLSRQPSRMSKQARRGRELRRPRATLC